MPKCEECQYLQRTSYEYGEYECEIFGENDEGGMFTENGCRYSKKTLERMASETRQAKNDYYEDFGKWYAERCNTKETCVICKTETTGDNTAICDSNHNCVEGAIPCGQIICSKCWEKQRHDSIYHDKIPDCCMNKSKMSVSDLLNQELKELLKVQKLQSNGNCIKITRRTKNEPRNTKTRQRDGY